MKSSETETRKTETKKKTPNDEKFQVLQENIPELKLWSPKDRKKSRDLGLGIQVAPRILKARHRRK